MFVYKSPIQGVHRTGAGSDFFFWIVKTVLKKVRHLIDIVGTRDIASGRKVLAIQHLVHPQHIRRYHPLKCVHIHLPKPLIHIVKIISHQQTKITNHHESSNMVTVTVQTYYKVILNWIKATALEISSCVQIFVLPIAFPILSNRYTQQPTDIQTSSYTTKK